MNMQLVREDDAFMMYETILKTFGPLSIFVSRTSGSPATFLIEGFPATGADLYVALKRFHGQNPEAEYELRFHSGNVFRGAARVTLPHMPENSPQQAQPTYVQQPPQPYQQPHQQPQYVQYPTPAPQQTQQSVQQAPGGGMNLEAVQALQKQLFDLLLAAQRSGTALVPPPAPAAPPPVAPPPPPPIAPPPPAAPAGPDLFQTMRQQLELLQEMQRMAAGGQQPQSSPVQQPVQQPPPQTTQQPPMQGPPGTIWVPNVGFVRLDVLYQAMTGEKPSGGSGYRVPPGPRSPYYNDPQQGAPPADPQYGQQPPPAYDPRYRPTYGQPQPPPREKTPIEIMREALGLSKTIVEMADQIRPPQAAPVAPEPVEPDNDSPVRVVDVGSAKMVLNAEDGSTRFVESLIANAPAAFKFVGEQMEAIRKAHAEREARKPQVQQLPPGYVEVGPGYVPPEGFVAVPVQQAQPVRPVQQAAPQPVQVLPDPPASMPAPIVEMPEQSQTWTPPSFVPGGSQ